MISNSAKLWRTCVGLCLATCMTFLAYGQPGKGDVVPTFRADDVFGQTVDLSQLPEADIVILFFFTSRTSEKLALRFRALQKRFGPESLYVAAIGLEEDREELRAFANRNRLDYFVLPNEEEINAETNYGPFAQRPVTYILARDRTLLSALIGSGESTERLMTDLARKYLEQGKVEKAEEGAEAALIAGEDPKAAQETLAYAKLGQGNTEEANALFEQLNLASGKARVALEAGDVEGAIEIAKAAGPDDAYAAAVLGQALMTSGNQEEALAAFEVATAKADALPDFQAAEALNGKGRLMHANGDTAAAKEQYALAQRTNYYAVEALSNLAAALQDEGETGNADMKEALEEAKEIIEKAQRIAADTGRDDALIGMLSQDIATSLERLANAKELEVRAQRIKDLGELKRKREAEGTLEPADPWTSSRRVIAMIPPTSRSTVFFARAGTELALRRAVERGLQAHPAIEVVDRDEFDGVLQELELSANDLTNDQTAIEIGQLFNAGFIGRLNFMESLDGKGVDLNVKAVKSETTQMPVNAPIEGVDKIDLNDAVQAAVDSYIEGIMAEPLRGRLVQDPDGDTVLIGLGSDYGVKPGMRFRIIVDGAPIVVRGKERPGPSKTVGLLEVTELVEGEGDLAYAKITQLSEGAEIGAETKIEEFRQ